jgi:hypothetical protein
MTPETAPTHARSITERASDGKRYHLRNAFLLVGTILFVLANILTYVWLWSSMPDPKNNTDQLKELRTEEPFRIPDPTKAIRKAPHPKVRG